MSPVSRRVRTLCALLCALLCAGAIVGAATGRPTGLTPDAEAALVSAYRPAGVDTSAVQTGTGADTRPNFIVVLTDDMRADDLQYMPLTQALMADRGITFTDAISPHPLCCPARAELLTGQYAQNNGVQHNESKYGGYKRLDSSTTLATWFSGYNTALIGKHANGYDRNSPRDPGWNIWDPLTRNRADYINFGFFGGDVFTDDYVTNRIEEKSNATLQSLAAADRPFLLYSNHLAPHERQPSGPNSLEPAVYEDRDAGFAAGVEAPSLNARSWNRKVNGGLPHKMKEKPKPRSYVQTRWQARVRSLQSVDRAVASLFATLEVTGEADNTYVFFTSDNGFSLGERRLQHKNNLVEEGLRVPLLVVGPGIAPGSTCDLPVTLVDIVATLADLGDVEPAITIDGASFAPALAGLEQPWRDTTLIQTGDKYNPSKDRRLKHKGWGLRGVRTERYTYAVDPNTGERMLFDRKLDPWELRNVAARRSYAPVAAELDRRTYKLAECTGRRCNRVFGPVPRPKARASR